MIERLYGMCVAKSPTGIVLDVAGVGYGVDMTDPALAGLEVGAGPLVVWVHTHVREDAIRLFGFTAHADRTLFAVLISLTGIGPKLAMAILGRMSAQDLAQAVELDDTTGLEDVPGIGGPRAKKILLELKPKIQKVLTKNALSQTVLIKGAVDMESAGATSGVAEEIFGSSKRKPLAKAMVADLQSALENFGYKDKELAPTLRKLERNPPSQDLAELVRLALQDLSGSRRAEGARSDSALKELF